MLCLFSLSCSVLCVVLFVLRLVIVIFVVIVLTVVGIAASVFIAFSCGVVLLIVDVL